jgi:ABC-type bacteriocin/lantibiotic exporter with double-glycine peptidase domain
MTSSSPTTHALEDGVICLAMVLAWFGKRCTLAQCRAACMPGRDGITTESLIEASRTLGLWAEDWVMQGADAFDTRLSLPAIVSWHESHFVVVERITRRHVILIDPAIGRRRMSRGLFDRFCSGVAVTFARARVDSETRWMTGLLIASMILLQICRLSLLVGMLLVLNRILSVGLEPSLPLVVAVILVVVAHAILQFVRSQAIAHLRVVSRRIGRRRRSSLCSASGSMVERLRGLQQVLMARVRFERLRQERDRECEGWR